MDINQRPPVYVTRAEAKYLLLARKCACEDFEHIPFRKAIENNVIPFPYSVQLDVYNRRKDGSLFGKIIIQKKGQERRYTRHVGVPKHLGSIGSRRLQLRGAGEPT